MEVIYYWPNFSVNPLDAIFSFIMDLKLPSLPTIRAKSFFDSLMQFYRLSSSSSAQLITPVSIYAQPVFFENRTLSAPVGGDEYRVSMSPINLPQILVCKMVTIVPTVNLAYWERNDAKHRVWVML